MKHSMILAVAAASVVAHSPWSEYSSETGLIYWPGCGGPAHPDRVIPRGRRRRTMALLRGTGRGQEKNKAK